MDFSDKKITIVSVKRSQPVAIKGGIVTLLCKGTESPYSPTINMVKSRLIDCGFCNNAKLKVVFV